MNFVFGVVCKVTNSFAKSKNSPRNFIFRLDKPKVWTPSQNPTNNGRHATGIELREIEIHGGTLLEEARDTLAAEGSFARKLEGGRAWQLEGQRACAGAGGRARVAERERADERREIARRVGDGVRRGRPKL